MRTERKRRTLNCGFCMMLRHAASTSMFRSFFSVFGKLEPLHITIELPPSFVFRTNPPFGPTVSSAPSEICWRSDSRVSLGHESPLLSAFAFAAATARAAGDACGPCA